MSKKASYSVKRAKWNIFLLIKIKCLQYFSFFEKFRKQNMN